jgi:hypothetical protein
MGFHAYFLRNDAIAPNTIEGEAILRELSQASLPSHGFI